MSIIERLPDVVDDPLEQIPVLPAEPIARPEILRRAADLIEKNGWNAGSLRGLDGSYCILGATRAAAVQLGQSESWSAFESSAAILGVQSEQAWRWNDRLPYEPRGFFPRRKPTPGARVARALRRLADGATWEEAIR